MASAPKQHDYMKEITEDLATNVTKANNTHTHIHTHTQIKRSKCVD